MSEPKVVISAVSKIGDSDSLTDEEMIEVWNELEPELDELERETYDGEEEPRFHEGSIYIEEVNSNLPVYISYHHSSKRYVVEVIIENELNQIQVSGLENILDEINNKLPYNFTLEAYYWYTGVDRTGGVS